MSALVSKMALASFWDVEGSGEDTRRHIQFDGWMDRQTVTNKEGQKERKKEKRKYNTTMDDLGPQVRTERVHLNDAYTRCYTYIGMYKVNFA